MSLHGILDLNIAQSIALREAIKEYESNKWKVIGQKIGKPAKVVIEVPKFSIFVPFN